MSTDKNTVEQVEDYELEDAKHQDDDVTRRPAALQHLTEDETRRLGRRATLKLDVIVMPAMTIMYILNYLDRQNIAASKLANIMEDLEMSVTQYNTCVSILFVGYSESDPRTFDNFLLSVRSLDAGSLKSHRQQDPVSGPLHLCGSGTLGRGIGLHRCRTVFRRPSCLPFHARVYRSCVLSWSILLLK